MASKRKASRPKSKKAKRTPAVSRAIAGRTVGTGSIETRLRALEARVRELESNPVLAMAGVLELELAGNCSTVRIKGNLQIVNGLGRTNTVNGCGNLILGYNEPASAASGWPTTRTGSHNLIIGRFHSHASYGALLAGEMNLTSANAPAACVVGGSEGSANADRVVVVGGHEGKGNGARSVVLGGFDNGTDAGTTLALVAGGTNNRAATNNSTILGGSGLTTTTPGQRIP
jgi:hypothetical protein